MMTSSDSPFSAESTAAGRNRRSMRILILGGDGMLGHQLLTTLAPLHDVHVTLRRPLSAYTHLKAISDRNATASVDAREWTHLSDVIKRMAPEALINCIGIVKHLKAAKDPIESLTINAVFPHRVAGLCAAAGAPTSPSSFDRP